jgi:hypothetical protein
MQHHKFLTSKRLLKNGHRRPTKEVKSVGIVVCKKPCIKQHDDMR